MRVLITGGGTAGHVNPALAIADIILQREADSVIEYVGTEKGIEGKLVPKKGMKLHPIRVRGLARSLSLSNIKALVQALNAKKECKRIIKAFQPDVVIGTGGYVCWPLISAAASLKVPAVLHEANAEPGFAVKTLRNQADLILVNFEGTKAYLKGVKATVERVGMPVNGDFIALSSKRRLPHISGDMALNPDEGGLAEIGGQLGKGSNFVGEGDKKPRYILSFGGSLGAHTLNQCALKLMKEFVSLNPHITFEHSCGAREYESMKKAFEEAGLNAYHNLILSEYIYDMPKKMQDADLVICRSGASTLAELAVAGKAALLIPSPNVTGDQQRKNAAQLLEKGAALVLEDSEAEDKIVETVSRLMEKDADARLAALSHNIKAFACSDCDERIYQAVKKLVAKD